MPHVTFIHGIANKPPAGISCASGARPWPMPRSAAWAISASPARSSTGPTCFTSDPRRISPPTRACSRTPPRLWTAAEPLRRSRARPRNGTFAGLRAKLTVLSEAESRGRAAVGAGPAATRCPRAGAAALVRQEAVPRRAFLRDVHHYLFDVFVRPARASRRCASSRRSATALPRR